MLKQLNKNIPVKRFVLAIIVNREKILLGYKKTGLGKGKWNGFGGKVEEFDISLEDAMVREVKEEAQIDITEYYRAAHLLFKIDTLDYLLDVTVYYCGKFKGTPGETEEMIPKWFDLSQIPYIQMWKDDPYWLPFVLNNHIVEAYFEFHNEEELTYHQVHSEKKL